MILYTLDGATCVRSSGNIVLTIPEEAVVRAATVPNTPEGQKYQVFDQNSFLDGFAVQILELSYDDFAGFRESELRRFVRTIIRTVAFLDER
jgi:hypothetical protein